MRAVAIAVPSGRRACTRMAARRAWDILKDNQPRIGAAVAQAGRAGRELIDVTAHIRRQGLATDASDRNYRLIWMHSITKGVVVFTPRHTLERESLMA